MLYRAFLHESKQDAEDRLEIHHQLRWIGGMLGEMASYVSSYLTNKKSGNIVEKHMPKHWKAIHEAKAPLSKIEKDKAETRKWAAILSRLPGSKGEA